MEGSDKTVDIKSLLPPGMKVNEGDIIELKVSSVAGGAVLAGYNYGEEGEGGEEAPSAEAGPPPAGSEEQGESWEDEFRKSMSPQKEQGSEY